eukprot:g2926.t1
MISRSKTRHYFHYHRRIWSRPFSMLRSKTEKPLKLYTSGTPNGHKVSIMLEEMQIPYDLHEVNLMEREQFSPEFIKMNPNARIPVLLHGEYPVMESAAAMMYLADTFEEGRQFLPSQEDHLHRYEVIQWLFFQMANVGPMQGQAVTFRRYCKENIPFAINRYSKETERLYRILETKLGSENEYIVRNQYSIADMAIFPWVRGYRWALGFEYEKTFKKEFPYLHAWVKRLRGRTGVDRGLNVPPIEKDNKSTQERLRKTFSKLGTSLVNE